MHLLWLHSHCAMKACSHIHLSAIVTLLYQHSTASEPTISCSRMQCSAESAPTLAPTSRRLSAEMHVRTVLCSRCPQARQLCCTCAT
uniref:Putative secreted protein n=1 Tax=Ixodes ricinus TaxID=34613 RepID=A0A147BBK9_IXORI